MNDFFLKNGLIPNRNRSTIKILCSEISNAIHVKVVLKRVIFKGTIRPSIIISVFAGSSFLLLSPNDYLGKLKSTRRAKSDCSHE